MKDSGNLTGRVSLELLHILHIHIYESSISSFCGGCLQQAECRNHFHPSPSFLSPSYFLSFHYFHPFPESIACILVCVLTLPSLYPTSIPYNSPIPVACWGVVGGGGWVVAWSACSASACGLRWAGP